MNTRKWTERVLIVLSVGAILLGTSMIAGCDGVGGVGGQGINISLTQSAPGGPAPLPGTEPLPLGAIAAKAGEAAAGTAANVSIINIHIVDGGTLTGNPSVGVDSEADPPATTAPTTQPAN